MNEGYPIVQPWDHEYSIGKCSDCEYNRRLSQYYWCYSAEKQNQVGSDAIPTDQSQYREHYQLDGQCKFWQPCERERKPTLVWIKDLLKREDSQPKAPSKEYISLTRKSWEAEDRRRLWESIRDEMRGRQDELKKYRVESAEYVFFDYRRHVHAETTSYRSATQENGVPRIPCPYELHQIVDGGECENFRGRSFMIGYAQRR